MSAKQKTAETAEGNLSAVPKPIKTRPIDETFSSDDLKKSAKLGPTKDSQNKVTIDSKTGKKVKTPRTKKQKIILGILIGIVVLLIIALVVFCIILAQKREDQDFERAEFPDPIYSVLTGEEIADAALNSSPTYCVQIPNGNDGGRPQAGLSHAGVVFEAIAEAGITRFAAVFQNTDTSVIGPVRSLRPYYLDWDTPFDCTVVHAGGSDEAIAALKAGGQRDLSENNEYMWREEGGKRKWNNLFTSPTRLNNFNQSRGYDTSTVNAFPRLTPDDTTTFIEELYHISYDENGNMVILEDEESATSNDNSTTTDGNIADQYTLATRVNLRIGNIAMFNPVYDYDVTTNTYLRSYANGEKHEVYDCNSGISEPNTSTCDTVQIAPSAVVAMIVQQSKMSDGYHENIKTIGSGTAYIFQNGTVIEGKWSKSAQNQQIVFTDEDGNEVSFAPGQLWITAVPQAGGVTWE